MRQKDILYKHKKVSSIAKEEYQGFLDNDEQLAEMYGKNIQLFRTNKANCYGFRIIPKSS